MTPTSASRTHLAAPRTASRRTAAKGALPGFTLIELMIALVLVLLLVLAMTQIFNVTSKAIGKGTATGEVVRGLDSARVALQIDFAGTDNIAYLGFGDESGILPTNRQPAIIISSTSIPAFVSERDMEADSDADPTTVDIDNDGTDDLPALGPYQIGTRWFRTDTLSFFARGEFESQTNIQPPSGPVSPSFYGNTTSREAWVWYGHGRVYNGVGALTDESSFWLPGADSPAANPNHFFASQFVLLRTPILLKALQPTTGGPTTVVDDNGSPVLHLRPQWDPGLPAANANTIDVGPLSYLRVPANESNVFDPTTNDFFPSAAAPFRVFQSRVDVAGVTASQYRQRLAAVQSEINFSSNSRLEFDSAYEAIPATWYNRLLARHDNDPAHSPQNNGRFWINPLVIKPLNAGEVSQASNYLLTGAAQFIVEYAGDFIRQAPNGEIATLMSDGTTPAPNGGLTPDGVIDFTIDANGVRHIRWYGMPRDVDGDGAIPGPALAPATPGTATDPVLLQSIDVRPLADYLPQTASATSPMTIDSGFPFEKRLPGEYQPNLSGPVQPRNGITDYSAALSDNFDWSYLAAWGPGDFDGNLYDGGVANTVHPFDFASPEVPDGNLRPSLIRVIITGIDHQAKLENAISQELVFRVPHE